MWLPPDEYGVATFGDMRLGLVDITRLEQRRENPRAMSKPEFTALKQSMDKFGFKSFVVVEELAPGRYGVIDGHHRWKAATERGMDRIPVVLLNSDTEKSWADLAMLTFNVTGEPQGDAYIDMLGELSKLLGADTTALFTALDENFLATFQQQMDDAAQIVSDADAADAAAGETPLGEAWQGRPMVLEFPRAPAILELFELVQKLTGEPVQGQAILTALREWVKIKRPAQDTITEDA